MLDSYPKIWVSYNIVHKKIEQQFHLFAKHFGIPPKVLVGILILIPLLIGTGATLNLVEKNSDNRSMAFIIDDNIGCRWCNQVCENYNIDQDDMCADDTPAPGYTTCEMNLSRQCVAGTAAVPSPTINPNIEACENVGGSWEEFRNGCVDSCDYAANPTLMCIQVLMYSCNCGPDKCWDAENLVCLLNPPIVPTATPQPTITPQPTPTTAPLPTATITPEPTATTAPEPSPTEPVVPTCSIADIASAANPGGYITQASVDDRDCCVDSTDRNFLISQLLISNPIQTEYNPIKIVADLNNDNKVNLWDYSILVSEWGQGCLPIGEPL